MSYILDLADCFLWYSLLTASLPAFPINWPLDLDDFVDSILFFGKRKGSKKLRFCASDSSTPGGLYWVQVMSV